MFQSSMPTKAVICYCPYEPNEPIPNVDLMTEKGCMGKLALEGTDNSTIVLQLLGLFDNKDSDIKSTFNKRFNELSLAILSNSDLTKEIAERLKVKYSEIESIQQVQKITADVIFIDFTNYNNSWNFINKLVTIKDVEYIQCILSPIKIKKEQQLFDSIKPRQSYEMKNGIQIDSINNEKELIYSYYHSGSGRKDNSTKYSLEKSGGNCKILAWHFFAEIGHKLGFVPKYGA